jgi:hypothetical protein
VTKFAVALGGIEIIAGENDAVYLEYGAGSFATATLTAGVYYLRGDASSDDFGPMLASRLTATASTNTYSVTVTTNGSTASWDTAPANVSAKVYVSQTGGQNFRVRWNHASTTFDPALLGFAAEKGAASTAAEISTLSPSCVWVANDYHKDIERTTSWDIDPVKLASGDTSVVRRSSKMQSLNVVFQWLDGRRVWQAINTTDPTATLESFIDVNNDGRPIELHEQSLLSSSVTTLSALSSSTRVGTKWRLAEGGGDELNANRAELGTDLWDLDLSLAGAV